MVPAHRPWPKSAQGTYWNREGSCNPHHCGFQKEGANCEDQASGTARSGTLSSPHPHPQARVAGAGQVEAGSRGSQHWLRASPGTQRGPLVPRAPWCARRAWSQCKDQLRHHRQTLGTAHTHFKSEHTHRWKVLEPCTFVPDGAHVPQ